MDLSGTAASTMDTYTKTLAAKGEEAKSIGASIASTLRSLLSFTATPTIQMPATPAAAPAGGTPSAPGRSSGGNVAAGAIYQVAEHRAEYFQPGQDGTILTGFGGGESQAPRATTGPISVAAGATFNFHGVQDMGEVARGVRTDLDAKLADEMRGLFSDWGVEVA